MGFASLVHGSSPYIAARAPAQMPRARSGRAGSQCSTDNQFLSLSAGHRGLEVRGHGGGPAVPVGVCVCVRPGHRGALPASLLPDPHAF